MHQSPTGATPSIAEIRAALKRWHDPSALARTYFAQSLLVQANIRRWGHQQPNPSQIASAIRDTLLEALHEVPRAGAQPQDSLLYREYVLRQSVAEICRADAIGRSTFFRNRDQELNELCIVLARQVAALSPVEAPQVPPLRRSLIASELPSVPVFVGRGPELAEACNTLTTAASGTILAVVGLPGAGKTTFAAALASDSAIRSAYPDGVLWASLGPTREVAYCLVEWLSTLDLDDSDQRTAPVEQQRRAVRTALAGRRVLIVLDDVWHVDDAQALMLGGLGAAYVLTTRQYPIAHHFTTHVLTLTDFASAESLALLQWYLPEPVLREARIHPDLSLIANRLGGLPLSVSVAAHQLRWLARTGQSRRFTDYADQQLANVATAALSNRVATSLQLIDDPARNALTALSLLPPKPNTLSEAMGCAMGNCDAAALDTLVDVGLVESQHGRYTLHPAIAEIAARMPADSSAPLRLAQYWAQALTVSETGLGAQDVFNLSTALDAAARIGRDDLYVEMTTHSVWLLETTGQLALLEQALRTALDKTAAATQRALLSVHLARVVWLRQRSDAALQILEEACQVAIATGDAALIGIASRTMADVTFEGDDLASAVRHVHQAGSAWTAQETARTKARVEAATLRSYMLSPRFDSLRRMLAHALPVGIAQRVDSSQLLLGLTGKGWLDFLEGDTDDGIRELESAFALAVERSHRLPELFAAGTLAWACAALGDYGKARQYGAGAAYAADRDSLPDFAVLAYGALGVAELAQGNTDNARNVLLDGLAYSEEQGAGAMGSGVHFVLAQVYLSQGDLPSARKHSEASYRLARDNRFGIMTVNSLSMMGTVAVRNGDLGRARTHFANAFREGRLEMSKANPWVNAFARLHYAEFLLTSGNVIEAVAQFERAATIAGHLKAVDYRGEALFGLARAKATLGNLNVAQAFATEGLAVLRGIGHVLADAVSQWLQSNA